MVGIGSGAVLMPAFAQRLIAMLGWRSTYMVIGLLVIVVSVPIVALFLKESPEESGLLPDDASVARSGAQKQNSEEGLSWREARHSAKFWLMVGAVFLVGVSVHGCVLHLAPLLGDQGLSPQQIALAITVLGSSLMIGRVASGYLLDRFFAPRVAMSIFGAVLGDRSVASSGWNSAGFSRRVPDRSGNGRRGGHHCLLDQPLLRSPCVWGDLWVRLCLIYLGRCSRSMASGAGVRSLRFLWLHPGGLLVGYFAGCDLDEPPWTVSISSGRTKTHMTHFPWKTSHPSFRLESPRYNSGMVG